MNETPIYYLANVPQDLRRRVLDLCCKRLWHEGLDLLRTHGFGYYNQDDLINFYHWAPAILPHQAAAPTPDPSPQAPRDYPQPSPEQIDDIQKRLAEAHTASPPISSSNCVASDGPLATDKPAPEAPPAALSAIPAVPAPGPAVARKRRGKIPVLPKEIRDELNARLEANDSYKTIIRWLARKGHPGFNQQNLHLWKKGGYQDWRRENERIQTQIMQREWLTEQVAQTKPGELFILIDQLFVTQLLDSLFGLDTGLMKQGLAASPRHFISLFSAYNRFKRDAMNSEPFRAFLQRERECTQTGKRGLSDEAMHIIAEAFGLPFPQPDPDPAQPSNIVKDTQT